MTDTAKLIAQARDEVFHMAANGLGDNGSLYLALADALEAAEAERDAALTWVDWCRERLESSEAKNRRLRGALEELVRREGFTFSSWDTAAFARAALAGSGDE